MLSYPVVPIEEWDALPLGFLQEHVSLEIELNELFLVLVAEYLRKESHVEEFVVSVFSCGLALGPNY